jgi:hypothetical protein
VKGLPAARAADERYARALPSRTPLMRATVLPTASRRALVALLAVALVLAQALGLLHRFAHGGGETARETASSSAASQDVGTPSLLQIAFGGHDPNAPQCELYDHVAHADILCGVPSADVPAAAPHAPPVRATRGQPAAFRTAFLARGPPAQG